MKDKVQKSIYLPSQDFEKQVMDRLAKLGFNGFSAYVNHLIANDIHNPLQDEFKVIERTYKANIKMYRDFSFSLVDSKESSQKICLLQFDQKFESFIKKLN
jgi:hypothetical protein